jgi:hypothetical protein
VEFRLLLDDDLEPHPDLVAVQRPTPGQVIMAAMVTGWLSDEPYLTSAAPAR